jgi:hypothetical protein
MKSCKAVEECWEAAGKSTRRAYSGKYMRRRRAWKRGLERILVGCRLLPKASAFPALTFTLCLFV